MPINEHAFDSGVVFCLDIEGQDYSASYNVFSATDDIIKEVYELNSINSRKYTAYYINLNLD